MKSVNQVRSVSDIKGIHFAGIRSIPKAQRSNYLELYVLDRELERLKREIAALDKRKSTLSGQWESVSMRMKKLHKTLSKEEETPRGISTRKPLKKMAIRY